jgi:hypothetical protein
MESVLDFRERTVNRPLSVSVASRPVKLHNCLR